MTEEINILLRDIGKSLSLIPQEPGIYFVVCQSGFKPDFIPIGTGGYFKGKNPNVSIDVLKEKWVSEDDILYIGQSENLRDRLEKLIRFGRGEPVGKWGGRYIWQIRDAEKMLQVRWEINESPRALEEKLLIEFKKKYGKLPFANLIM